MAGGSPPGRAGLVVLGALGLLVLASLSLQLWGIAGDLPYPPDVDEPIFISAAVHLLQHRTLNPGWFGNPGSTVIYPLAALIEIWYQLARHLPFVDHPVQGIGAALQADPTPFYLIGRLVSAAYGAGCVVATWLVARRAVGNAAAVIAAAFIPGTAIVNAFGQIVRTDTAGAFFALISVWLILRAVERGRRRDWVAAAVAIGIAASTRYFFAVLVIPYVVGAWLWWRAQPRSAGPIRKALGGRLFPFAAVLIAPAAFFATSPYVLLDAHKAIADIQFEARSVHPGADGLSPLGNFAWYVGTEMPAVFGLLSLGTVLIGIVLLARRRPAVTAVLLVFAASYLAGISASPLHWDRYVIPLAPIVGVFAAATLWAVGTATARLVKAPRHQSQAVPAAVASLLVLALLLPGLQSTAAADRLHAQPSTRVLATRWVEQNVPIGNVVEEMYCTYLAGTSPRFAKVEALAAKSIAAYRAAGVAYLITSRAVSDRYLDATRYPVQSAFYQQLGIEGRLLASFVPDQDHGGSRIDVYDIRAP